jgi:signal transduction histidine kinase
MRKVLSLAFHGGARRIFSAGLGLIVITVVAAAISIWDLRRHAIDSYRDNMVNLGVVLAEQLSLSIQGVDLVLDETLQNVLRSGATTPEEFRQWMASEATHSFLAARLQQLPQASELFLTDASGNEINSSNFWPVPALDLSDRAYFRDAQAADGQGLLISGPTKSRTTGRWTFFLTRRVESRAGVFLGTAQAALELRHFENFYQTITMLEDASVAVLRQDGLVLVRHPRLEGAIGTYVPKESPWYANAVAGGTYRSPGYLDGVVREIAVRPLKDYPLVLTVTVPEYTALAAWRRQASFIGVSTLFAVIVFAILFRSLAGQFLQLERSERALVDALATTEQADRAKSDFLGRMSHELRTPLNAIIGFSEVMTTGLFGPLGSPRYLEYAQDIYRSGRYLHELISDMLDMVKIESGNRELRREVFDFVAEVQEALRMVQSKAEAGQVTTALELVDSPEGLLADRRAFKQILLNLLGNAVKFTPPGGKVTVRLTACGPDAIFQVVDTGVGISPANVAKLGTPFFRVEDDPHQASTEGTGLGLALTKSLIELHGWQFEIDSELGVGTTVTVRMSEAGTWCPVPKEPEETVAEPRARAMVEPVA